MSAGEEARPKWKDDSLYYKSPYALIRWLYAVDGHGLREDMWAEVMYFRSVFRPKSLQKDALTLDTLMSLQSLFVLDNFGFSRRKSESISTLTGSNNTVPITNLSLYILYVWNLYIIYIYILLCFLCLAFCLIDFYWVDGMPKILSRHGVHGVRLGQWRAEPAHQEDCWNLRRNMFSFDLITSPQKNPTENGVCCAL